MTTTRKAPTAAGGQQGDDVRARLRARTRPTTVLTICDDPAVKDELSRAQFAARAAQAAATEEDTAAHQAALTAAQTSLEAAQAVFDQVAIRLRFQALERPVWEALKAKHKPTEEQAEDGLLFDGEALAPDLIAAASLDGITVDDARHYLDTWATGEAIALYNAAFGVQHESRLDVGKG